MCKLKDYQVGDKKKSSPVLITNITEAKTASNKPYVILTLFDGETEIKAKKWSRTKDKIMAPVNSVIIAELECQDYQGEKSFVMDTYGPAAGVKPEDLMKKAPEDPERMYSEMVAAADEMDEDLAKVVRYILESKKDRLLVWPGAMTVHHAYRSGLLYHSYRIMQNARSAAEIYGLNKGLMLSGAILHDIGKLEEVTMDEQQVISYTTYGNAFGHVNLGSFLVYDAIEKCSLPMTENLMLLVNIILSHHILPEHGACAKPISREAYAIGMLDNMDAKMDIYTDMLKQTEPGTCSERMKYVNGSVAYNPRAAEPEKTAEPEPEQPAAPANVVSNVFDEMPAQDFPVQDMGQQNNMAFFGVI